MLTLNLLPKPPLSPGSRIGHLTVVGEAGLIPNRKRPMNRIELKCDCGQRVFRSAAYLMQVLSEARSHQCTPKCRRCAYTGHLRQYEFSPERMRGIRKAQFMHSWEEYGSLYPPTWEDDEFDAIVDELEAMGLGRPELRMSPSSLVVDSASEGIYSEPRDLVEYSFEWKPDLLKPLTDHVEPDYTPPKRAKTLAQWANWQNMGYWKEQAELRQYAELLAGPMKKKMEKEEQERKRVERAEAERRKKKHEEYARAYLEVRELLEPVDSVEQVDHDGVQRNIERFAWMLMLEGRLT